MNPREFFVVLYVCCENALKARYKLRKLSTVTVFSQPPERYNLYQLNYFINWRNNLTTGRYQN